MLIHAGLYPFWSVSDAVEFSEEVENILTSENNAELFSKMFGNLPDKWHSSLQGWERIRFIINACTRMRFCSDDGKLELTTKGIADNNPGGFKPWFNLENKNIDENLLIIFGHWSALVGETNVKNKISLDTGCIWGNSLTALRLEDKKKFSIACPQYCSY